MSNRRLTRLPRDFTKSYSCSNISFGTDFEFSIVFWQDPTNTQNTFLASVWEEATANRGWALRLTSTSIVLFESPDGTATNTVATLALAKDQINHVTFKKVGTAITLTLNGVDNGYTSAFGTAYVSDGSGAELVIGSKTKLAEALDGYILGASVTLSGTETHRWIFNGDGTVAEPDLIGSSDMAIGTIVSGDVSTFTRTNESSWTDGVETLTYGVVPTKWAVWLVGQSNMVGRDSIELGVDDVYTEALGALQWGYGTQSIVTAANPLDHINEDPGDMGCWLEFANNMVSSALVPFGYDLTFVPCAQGATSLQISWQKGAATYNNAVASYNAFHTAYSDSVLGLILWLQGETDADNGRSTAQYKTDFYQMRTDMIADIVDVTTDTYWILCEILGSSTPANIGPINTALAEIVSENSNIRLVQNTDLTLFDTYHYNAASQRVIGQRFHTQYELFVSGQVITINFTGSPTDGSYRMYLKNSEGVVVIDDFYTITSSELQFDLTGYNGQRLLGYIFGPAAYTEPTEAGIQDNMALVRVEVP